MLICSDCGHPRGEKAQAPRVKLQQVATAGFLAAVTTLAITVLRVSVSRTLPLVPERTTQAN